MIVNQFLNLQKMEKQMREMGELRFFDMKELFPFDAMEDRQDQDVMRLIVPDRIDEKKVEKGDRFDGRDRYLWLRKNSKIPRVKPGLRPVGYFDFGLTGGGHNSGFESLLYVNQKAYQGVDSNHQEVLFDDIAGQDVELTFMLWTGLEGGGEKRPMENKLRRAQIGYLHEATDELYYYSKAIVKTLFRLEEDHPAREDLFGAMEAMLREIDWDMDGFYSSVETALATLKSRIAAIKKESNVTVNCVGHSHIDVAWLWRLKHTREKAMRSFASVLHMMDEFDDYIFFQSQPQLYKYLKTDNPELYATIKEKVVSGKWETDGGMWLEADCNISSGEALARQLLVGTRFFEKEFGVKSTVLWLPDVFGYSWALPQILTLCGIKNFVTTKISWNQFNTIPNDLFTWRGIDGSEVTTYFIETPEVGHAIDSRFSTYNGQVSPRSVLGSWKKFKNKELTKETLLAFGYGDGGGGPTRNMLKMRQAMDQLPGLPNVKNSKVRDFFERVHTDMQQSDRPIPVWDGELYLEYHRGTYTSQAQSKKWNRRLENELVEAELLSVLAIPAGMEYPREIIDEGWEVVLRNQFHDIIPGSSIHEVYEDSMVEYGQAGEALKTLRNKVLSTLLNPKEDTFTLFSSSSFDRKDVVFIETDLEGKFEDGRKMLPAQRVEGGYHVGVGLKPLEIKTIRFVPGEELAPLSVIDVNMDQRTMTTPYYDISWDDHGRLSRVYDKLADREVLRQGGLGNVLEVYEDKPIDYENWDIDIFHTQKKEEVKLVSAELIECGSVRAVIRFTYSYRKSSFVQDMVVYADNRRIDFQTQAAWHEDHRLLKAAFHTDIHTNTASYDIQYGHAKRPTHSNTSWDMARFEVVAHKWADISESNFGVSVLNNCKYGYSAKDGNLFITLLKSGKFPDTEADMGDHTFTYSLLPHSGNVENGNTIEEANALNLPIRICKGEAKKAGAALSIDSDAVQIDAIKLAEDGKGVVVRMHECRGGKRKVKIETPILAKEIRECNILEEETEMKYCPQNWTVEFKPFEIKSFRII